TLVAGEFITPEAAAGGPRGRLLRQRRLTHRPARRTFHQLDAQRLATQRTQPQVLSFLILRRRVGTDQRLSRSLFQDSCRALVLRRGNVHHGPPSQAEETAERRRGSVADHVSGNAVRLELLARGLRLLRKRERGDDDVSLRHATIPPDGSCSRCQIYHTGR